MDNTKTGGPAYPSRVDGYKVSERERDDLFAYSGNHPGKTLLDDFAGLAMQGLVANPRIDRDLEGTSHQETVERIAKSAYSQAAAMIAERNRLMNEKPC